MPPEHVWTEAFKAWVWSPPGARRLGQLNVRQRGYANAVLEIHPAGFTVRANRLEQIAYGWRQAEYGGPGLLFDISGDLARCSVRFQRERLLPALERAGLAVVEVRRWGWEAPQQVSRALLGVDAGEVLDSIISG